MPAVLLCAPLACLRAGAYKTKASSIMWTQRTCMRSARWAHAQGAATITLKHTRRLAHTAPTPLSERMQT